MATNIERMKDLIDDTYATQDDIDSVNGIVITDEEIDALKKFKEKLGLEKIQLGVYTKYAKGGV